MSDTCNCKPWNTIPLSVAQAWSDAGLHEYQERRQRRAQRTVEEKLLDDLVTLLDDLKRQQRIYASLCERAAKLGYGPAAGEMLWDRAADIEQRIANLKLDMAMADGVTVEVIEEAARERR